MKLMLALALGGATFVSATPSPEPVARYRVAMSVSDNGAMIGEPRLIVAKDAPARVALDGADGARIDVRFSVGEKDATTAMITSQLELTDGQGRSFHAAPSLSVRLGESGTIEFGPQSQGRLPASVRFIITRADS